MIIIIMRRLEETYWHSVSSEKPSANAEVKNSKGVNDNDDKIPINSILLANWKNCRKWGLYQLLLVVLVQTPKDW